MPYGNTTYNRAFQNAVTCLYSGYSKNEWDSCGVDEYIAEEIWQKAVDKFFTMISRY